MKINSTKSYLLSALLATSGALISTGYARYGFYSEYNRLNNMQKKMVINNKNLSTDILEKNNKENNKVTNAILLAIAFSLIATGFTSLALIKDKQNLEG